MLSKSSRFKRVPTSISRQRRPYLRLIAGIGVGLLVITGMLKLHVIGMSPLKLLIILTLCVLIALTRFRIALWIVGATVGVATLAVGYTPLMRLLLRQIVIRDYLTPVDAIVVLSADIDAHGVPSAQGQRRLSHAFTLLQKHYAPCLVVTKLYAPKPSSLPFVRHQLQTKKITCMVEEVGPVANTHDEAISTAALAKRHDWHRVIIVSDGSHMRRARALFAKAGLPALCSPCTTPLYDLDMPRTPAKRYAAFRDWRYETTLYYDHKLRGWL